MKKFNYNANIYTSGDSYKRHLGKDLDIFHELIIQADQVIMLRRSTAKRRPSASLKRGLNKENKTTYVGQLTKTAIRSIWKAQRKMVLASTPFKAWHRRRNCYVNAIMSAFALTIPFIGTPVSCHVAQRMALKFTRWMEQTKGIKVWLIKGEFTENLQPHFHFLTISYLDHKSVRKKWNQLLKDELLLESYAAEYGHYDPPSIDYVPLCDKKEADSYLSSYLKKSTQNKQPWVGRLWRQSKFLREMTKLNGSWDREQRDLLKAAEEDGAVSVKKTYLGLHEGLPDGTFVVKRKAEVILCTIWKVSAGYRIEDVLSSTNLQHLCNYRASVRDGVNGYYFGNPFWAFRYRDYVIDQDKPVIWEQLIVKVPLNETETAQILLN